MSLAEHPPSAIQDSCRLVRGRDTRLREHAIRVRARELVALHPHLNRRGTATENGLTTSNTNCDGDIVEPDVVEDEGACEFAVARLRGTHEDGRVCDNGVDDSFSSDSLKVRYLE